MKEYIERAAAMDAILGLTIADPAVAQYADAVCYHLQNLPAADVVEVVRGEWEWQEEWGTFPNTDAFHLRRYGWYCTRCGIELGEYLTKVIGRRVDLDDDFSKPDLKYCPNCGADMRGETI